MAGFFAKPMLSGMLQTPSGWGGQSGNWGSLFKPGSSMWGKPPAAPAAPMKSSVEPMQAPAQASPWGAGGNTTGGVVPDPLSTIGRAMGTQDAMPGMPQTPPLAPMTPASPEDAIMSGGQLDIKKLWALIQGRGQI